MVYRVYVEKKPQFALEASALLRELRSFLGIRSLEGVRLLNRYDVERADKAHFDAAVDTIFSEPQLDVASFARPEANGAAVFATEFLPGQFDQRADSAAQCMQLAFECERPLVRSARVYMLSGALSAAEIEKIKAYVINPVESREASLALPDTLDIPFDAPGKVPVLSGFTTLDAEGLKRFIQDYALAMDEADIAFCQAYFAKEQRDPSLTEIRLIDTYWSDHCRHTTFLTELSDVRLEDEAVKAAFERYLALREEVGAKKPVTLMDIATIGTKALKKRGLLPALDESDEINACTIKIDVDVDGVVEPWLLLFKNETHNHPTEIEPFGGAATCIGGAIRDPLSGRGFVYQAMRVTGAADPTLPLDKTIPGKLPQKKLVQTAAAGFSAYGNQIGLATGIVEEIYHPGYAAKRMEIGAVIGAAPAANVRREVPQPGDVIVLLGGRTGRDGCGGATGSSKSHSVKSLSECGAEVQKGNPPEERKLQRLFMNPEAARLIKRCNDFGAGGVSVAIGELADGLEIDLSKVPKKYEGLSGTELAISESQERMAVVLDPKDAPRFVALATEENLEASLVATVSAQPRLRMLWNGDTIVDISREFLNSNGAPKTASALVSQPKTSLSREGDRVSGGRIQDDAGVGDTPSAPLGAPPSKREAFGSLAEDLNVCSRRGLAERFDATIGSGSVLMPFGGKRQRTPAQAMAALLPVGFAKTETVSAMAHGFDPFVSGRSPYRGAYLAVLESLSKLVASGAGLENAHLSLQEYFPRVKGDPQRWGLPLAALLGALDAQLDFSVAAIGGKDSMSGSFEGIDVPPTLVSFAVSTSKLKNLISPEFKRAGSPVALLRPAPSKDRPGLPDAEDCQAVFETVTKLIGEGKVLSAYTPGMGGVAAALCKMCLGNAVGFALSAQDLTMDELLSPIAGAFILELSEDLPVGMRLGATTEKYAIDAFGNSLDMLQWEAAYEARLEGVFASGGDSHEDEPQSVVFAGGMVAKKPTKVANPRVLIPCFPGTNCELDAARVFQRAGAIPEVLVIKNLSAEAVRESVLRMAKAIEQSQIVFLPGGFSGGDEPDGSAKFITAFLRNPRIADALMALLNQRDGLIGGVCNGFQALIKLGLVPYGEIREPDADAPTLTYNTIGRHQSRLVRTRVCSKLSPWLSGAQLGDIQLSPISHGEGRFVVSEPEFLRLAQNGQIATQYADELGRPSMDIDINPNGSLFAVEGITSPDGRVFGRMAHPERNANPLYINVPGNKDCSMFGSAVDYFS